MLQVMSHVCYSAFYLFPLIPSFIISILFIATQLLSFYSLVVPCQAHLALVSCPWCHLLCCSCLLIKM